MFECVINISEGRDTSFLEALCELGGPSVRDLHVDEVHNRSVFTLINEADGLIGGVRALLTYSFGCLDLTRHRGVHPRFGVVDVVPFVALGREDPLGAVALRDATARWISDNFDVPVFLYGPVKDGVRTLPEVRKQAFRSLHPDFGPWVASAKLGASAVGARPVLVAWNLWLRDVTFGEARVMARDVRQPDVRALAFAVSEQVQISCNLLAPLVVGPSVIYDAVASMLPAHATIVRAELVGLAPRALLEREPRERWVELGLSDDATIESRVAGS